MKLLNQQEVHLYAMYLEIGHSRRLSYAYVKTRVNNPMVFKQYTCRGQNGLHA
jgi:hypothetical protein